MFLAELKGKLSSRTEGMEDILTSNVFSFFKYSTRSVYLKKLLQVLQIECSSVDLEQAEFNFWPTYGDGTEPDLVLKVGAHYLLIEAKLYSGFGQETETHRSQIDREVTEGLAEAKSLGKQFHFFALTNHYHFPTAEFKDLPKHVYSRVRWFNWQKIAEILLDLLEQSGEDLPDRQFAEDLYELLAKKKLRGFISFQRLQGRAMHPPQSIFFDAKTASFRGSFIGFASSLQKLPIVPTSLHRVFFKRVFFRQFPVGNLPPVKFQLGGNNDKEAN